MSSEKINELYALLQKNINTFNAENNTQIGISFGYSFYDSKTDNSLDYAFKRADENMYQNKIATKATQKSE